MINEIVTQQKRIAALIDLLHSKDWLRVITARPRLRELGVAFSGNWLIIPFNKARQGYALRSTLKPAGYFFVRPQVYGHNHAL